MFRMLKRTECKRKRDWERRVKDRHSPVVITEIHSHRGVQPDGDPGKEETMRGEEL